MEINEVVVRSTAARLSYGMYVYRMGAKIDRRSSEYILERNEIRCKQCKKAFTPSGKHNIYCTPACRRQARSKHK